MVDRFVSERNIKFMLYEVFDLEGMTRLPYFSEHNKKMFDRVLDAAMKLSKDLLFPDYDRWTRPGKITPGLVQRISNLKFQT